MLCALRQYLIPMLLIGLLATTADAVERRGFLPPGTLTAEELTALFSDKTVESVTAVRGRVSLSYYSPTGEVRQERNGRERFGQWRVTNSGRICLQMEQLPEKCRIVVKEGREYKKYIVRKNGQHQHSVTYRKFVNGNPYGL